MPTFTHDEITFHYRDEGTGAPFIFQHGLGGDITQPFGFFEDPHPGIRLIALDCRAHGETRPLGRPDKIAIAAFADDVVALMDHLHIKRAIVGGISMGSAVALNLALRYPYLVSGLVLSRPAWLDAPMPPSLEVFPIIAALIREHGARQALERFKQTDHYAAVLAESPDGALTLLTQFEHPRTEECVIRLERIPRDAPNLDRAEWALIDVPTLVLHNRKDPVHPRDFAEIIAGIIPRATLREVTCKSESIEQHARDVRAAIQEFFRTLNL